MSSPGDTEDSFLDELAARTVIDSDGHVTSVNPPPVDCLQCSRTPGDRSMYLTLTPWGEQNRHYPWRREALARGNECCLR